MKNNAGKGSAPRNLSEKFRQNYENISWRAPGKAGKGGGYMTNHPHSDESWSQYFSKALKEIMPPKKALRRRAR